ncbi:MAG: Isocitrate/isopropylmalate dehydrogenase [Thermoleophilia bacterium]|nr:Isocitrate/isopropylmalate dehydrogenase [Thermoleophilia bacterium]
MTTTETAPHEGTKRTTKTPITVIRGDGIGPEVVGAALRLMEEAGALLDIEECIAGAEVFRAGDQTGVPDDTIASIERTGVALKGPLETPIGFGEKSANVTLRKMFETYGNIRPAREIPGLETPYAGRGVDLVIVRENLEDLYAGIEHMQTPGVCLSLKVITHHGSEKIARLAFEYARATGRTSVTCATKANIMKLGEGMFKRTFDEVAVDYPDIEARQILVDNCAHQLVMRPEQFDVIVTTNMNGDILSDLTSGLIGGLGFAPSANIGSETAMFEAVHGSAPDIAGKDIANPSAIMFSAAMMLRHIGQQTVADRIEDAVLYTLEEGKYLTGDIAKSHDPIGTTAYTDAVIGNLGKAPAVGKRRESRPLVMPEKNWRPTKIVAKERAVVGMEVLLEEAEMNAAEVGAMVERCTEGSPLRLALISSRGTKVYPGHIDDVEMIETWRCRFVRADESIELSDDQIFRVLSCLGEHFRWSNVQKLQVFDGEPGYTKVSGED